MPNYQREFIRFALDKQDIGFGEFTLKSGRRALTSSMPACSTPARPLGRLGRFMLRLRSTVKLDDIDVIFGRHTRALPWRP